MHAVDCIIVGAGAAGIAAARRLATVPGLSFLVLEARDRIGGRAFTVTQRLPVAVDAGAEWLHAADQNPLVGLFEANGAEVVRRNPAWGAAAVAHGLSSREQADCSTALERAQIELERLRTLPDQPLAAVLPAATPYQDLCAIQFAWISGGDPAQVSLHDFQRFRDTGQDWPVVGGLGAAVAQLGRGLPIALNQPVRQLRLSAGGVEVLTVDSRYSARVAIVTLPIGVLTSGQVRFEPDLPALHQQALDGLVAGAAEKVWLRVKGDPFGFPADTFLISRVDRREALYLKLKAGGADVVQGFIDGPLATLLADESGAALAAFAMDELVHLFGNAVRRRLEPAWSTDWRRDPWSRGAYSYARPGAAAARAALAVPIAERLYLAGEACDLSGAGAVHGAFNSGDRAGRAALARLGHALADAAEHEARDAGDD